jgi:DNA-binding transcriptional ArsR family regulator
VPKKVKATRIADVILHPERLAILRVFEESGPLTVRELCRGVRSISESTVYRHVKVLLRAGAIRIVETRPKQRGAPETVYALADPPLETIRLSGRERSSANMKRYFLAVTAAQIADFENALEAGPLDVDRFAVRRALIHVNAAELREIREMLARLKEFASNQPAGRTALSLGFVLFPAGDAEARMR